MIYADENWAIQPNPLPGTTIVRAFWRFGANQKLRNIEVRRIVER
ncbi:MAG TPA: hypothetical protein VK993_10885 [Chthoniobacterales bacterium]|nr:hypothetical protein [Chthoniobacterales bacterium]